MYYSGININTACIVELPIDRLLYTELNFYDNIHSIASIIPLFLSWLSAAPISMSTAVAELGSTAPNTQASLWLPNSTEWSGRGRGERRELSQTHITTMAVVISLCRRLYQFD